MLVFLFTDIEGSSKLWEAYTEVMTDVIARHDEILRELVESHGGRVTKRQKTRACSSNSAVL